MADELTILEDSHHARADMRLIRRSARAAWGVGRKVKHHAVQRVAALLEDDNQKPYVVLAAANTLVAMDRADIAADKADAPREQHNTQVNVYMPANSRESQPAIVDVQPQGIQQSVTQPESAIALLPHTRGQGEQPCEIVQLTPPAR